MARMRDIPATAMNHAVASSGSYRQALLRLGKYYCSGAIAQLRTVAESRGIDLSHLSGNRNPANESQRKVNEKNRRANDARNALRGGPPVDYSQFIVSDSRRNDKKRGFANDLSRDSVRALMAQGCCSYCGDTETKLTLDRKDNNVGHILDNVVVACFRCNMVRGTMPFDAWMNIAPTMRETREKGLLRDWLPFGRSYRGR